MKKRICSRIQTTLATAGPEALRQDKNAQRHLEECGECFAILESLHELDLHLENLPVIDAPDETVQALLARPEIVAGSVAPDDVATQAPDGPPWWSRWWPRFESGRRAGPLAWAGGAAATLLLIVAFSVSLRDLAPPRQLTDATDRENGILLRYAPKPSAAPRPTTELERGQVGDKNREIEKRPMVIPDLEEPVSSGEIEVEELAGVSPTDLSSADPRSDSPDEGNGYLQRRNAENEGAFRSGKDGQVSPGSDDEFYADYAVSGRAYQNILRIAPGVRDADGDGDPNVGSRSRDFKAVVGGVSFETEAQDRESDLGQSSRSEISGPSALQSETKGDVQSKRKAWRDSLESIDRIEIPGTSTARDFLDSRRSVDGLSYQPARGYWANSYVPGDPALRLLQTRLLAVGGRWLDPDTRRTLSLHDASRRTIQPFDPPQDSALAIYLHADRTGLEQEGRMLVQVGLEATERHAGRRPPMNVGVVLDLRGEIAAETAASVRALVEALNESRQPGDRFGIVVAGRPGGRVVAPGNFKHGYLTVTLGRLLGEEAGVEGPRLGIEDAMGRAIQDVAGVDDPDAPLGSSAVLLITSGSFGGSAPALTDMAHQSAVAGVPVSVIGIGGRVRTDEIERLTLAGQGNRRLLASPAEASDLVDRELSAVSRAVARAVRLRIRLAPGVRLIDVIGSERLDEAGAQRVRDAENSVDLRLARSLGIEADRGEDEDGLQIVIPSFYAGDSHVVLLDVVAPGPGPVADVVARYKDLAHLNNGVARASLAVGSDERAAGPLERNVLKNYLAALLSDALEAAGNDLAAGNRQAALDRLTAFQGLLAGLRVEVPGLEHDTETIADIAMLDEYGTLLQSGAVERPEQLAYLSNSLRYAARLKLLAAPQSN